MPRSGYKAAGSGRAHLCPHFPALGGGVCVVSSIRLVTGIGVRLYILSEDVSGASLKSGSSPTRLVDQRIWVRPGCLAVFMSASGASLWNKTAQSMGPRSCRQGRRPDATVAGSGRARNEQAHISEPRRGDRIFRGLSVSWGGSVALSGLSFKMESEYRALPDPATIAPAVQASGATSRRSRVTTHIRHALRGEDLDSPGPYPG